MDAPPVPKPRSAFLPSTDPSKKPVPMPRNKTPNANERLSTSDLFRSLSTVSKQITEDVAQKVQSSAKSANEKIEKTILDGSKFAKDTFGKTISTSRAVRDSVTKSVIEGTISMRRKKHKKSTDTVTENDRSASMPIEDVNLFGNIQFHSPLVEQKKLSSITGNQGQLPSMNLNSKQFDNISIVSNNSDLTTDTVSNFSHDSRDFEVTNLSSTSLQNDQMTYDTPRASRTNSTISDSSTPEIPERRMKKGSFEYLKQNSMYENWNLPGEPLLTSAEAQPEKTPRVSKSTIFEFDPLNTNTNTPKLGGVSNELLLLELFIIGDTYGTPVASDSNEDSCEYYAENDYFNPPTPPERTDSLYPEETTDEAVTNTKSTKTDNPPKDSNSNWFADESTDKSNNETEDVKVANMSVMRKFSSILKLDNVRHKSHKANVQKNNIVLRPPVNSMLVPFYSGYLTRSASGGVEDIFKNTQTRYCVLSEQKLTCYTDPTNLILKEVYTLDSIYSLQTINVPITSAGSSNYCIELSVNAGSQRSAPKKVLFSCNSASERKTWAQKIAEHLTYNFTTKHTMEYTRCGWCYMKEGVSGEWQGAWVMLIRRVLVYYTTHDSNVKTVDLRKTRCVVTQEGDEETKSMCPTDGSANLVLDCPNATLYLRFPHERELKGWRYMIKLAAHNNGAYIHHQQLTNEDVPTVVDKCINFIYAHGSLSEGIYRRTGSNSVMSELLGRFRRNAWAVQLSPSSHSEHDVAGVLKRFFRELPEPLIPSEIHELLIAALDIEDEQSRHGELRGLLANLPLVARKTARKLFAHLHFLHTMAHTNKMNAENLASVWTPTIMPSSAPNGQQTMSWSTKEVNVVCELISKFESVWQPTDIEKRREVAVRTVLTRVLSNVGTSSPKAAGDLRAWVYLHDRNNCVQVILTPNKKSSDLCVELCEKAKIDSHKLMLEEVICGDSMRRVIHLDEIVLDVVLRWGYWDEEDRKDNYLLVTENKVLHELETLRSSNSLVCGSLKYANETSKAFKSYMFEFKSGKLCYFKDKQGSQQVEEWNIKDILWYTGHETKRNPQLRWAITFIPRNNKRKRCKERPWFGSTIAGAVTDDQLKWMAAMMFAEHATVLPTPRLVIT